MKAIRISALNICLFLLPQQIFSAASSSTSIDFSTLLSFHPGKENKVLFWHGQSEPAALKVALLDGSARTIKQADTAASFASATHAQPDEPYVTITGNDITIQNPHGKITSLASIFASQSNDTVRRFVLLAPSQSQEDFESLTGRLNAVDFHMTLQDISTELATCASPDQAFALIDLYEYLQATAGPKWQKELPTSLYNGKPLSEKEIKQIKKSERRLALAAGTVVGTAALAGGIIAAKKGCTIQ